MPTPPRGPACRRFTGYKPCRPGRLCEACDEGEPFGRRVLLISLDALGAVIQSTALLAPIHRAWGPASVTWVTMPGNRPVLEGNPRIHRALSWDLEAVTALPRQSFDVAINLDKSAKGAALLDAVSAPRKLGFGLSPDGQIVPRNPEAEPLWRLGLDDELKFRRNDKPGTRLLTEALGLEWKRDPYDLPLTGAEQAEVAALRRRYGVEAGPLVGFNTGCSDLFPNKKLSIEQHVGLIGRVRGLLPTARPLLLGGPGEEARNGEIAMRTGATETPTREGLRRGLLQVAACDVVVTGDTSALHMAVALGRRVVAWFGLSCAAEIDLYDRGVKLVSTLPCAPCWKARCEDPRCVAQVDLEELARCVAREADRAVEEGRGR